MDNLEQKKNDERWLMLQLRITEIRLVKVFNFLRDNNIEPILIKGWAASRNYPKPWERLFSDIDIAVAPKDYEKALVLSQPSGIQIDYHRGLRHLDSVEWNDLYANSILVEVNKTPIRILRPEDHLRVLCVHWLNDGGADRQRLEDIFYAVRNRPANFDWKRCLKTVKENRQRWVIYVIGLTHRYLDLEIDDLPFADHARQIPNWMIKEIEAEWRSGLRLIPLNSCFHDKKMLYRQILKRIPPNGIEATIEADGDLDAKSRIHYQLKSISQRFKPSIRRIFQTLSSNK